uniref:Uncharacterized protein n=1 Tax=Opuntia streptacantha TaxID=393608 RepID=A0A7C9ESC3_OPUST
MDNYQSINWIITRRLFSHSSLLYSLLCLVCSAVSSLNLQSGPLACESISLPSSSLQLAILCPIELVQPPKPLSPPLYLMVVTYHLSIDRNRQLSLSLSIPLLGVDCRL